MTRPRNKEFRVAIRPDLHAEIKELALKNRFAGSPLNSISTIVGSCIAEWLDAGMPKFEEPPVRSWYAQQSDDAKLVGVQTTFRLASPPYAEQYVEAIVGKLREDSLRRSGARLSCEEVSGIVSDWLSRRGVVDAPSG